MTQQVQIVFHGLNRSEAIETTIHDKIEHLKHFDPQIESTKVTITREGHQLQSEITVHVEVRAAGQEIFAKRAHPEALAAVNDAFDTLRRNVKEAHDRRLGR